MDQNIIGLAFKTGTYPEPVTVSGCHGYQVKVQNFHIQKVPNFDTIKKRSTDKIFYTYKLVMGIFMRLTAISAHGNHLFLIKAP